LSPFSLRGKTIVQFGGTGLLGRALVHSLVEADATLVVASRSRTSMEPIVSAERAVGRTVHVDEVDITSEPSIIALRDRILTTHTRVDGIVFNAVTRPMRSNDDPLATWAESMAVNATGYFAAVRAFGDVMARQRAGSIVSISSMYGMVAATSRSTRARRRPSRLIIFPQGRHDSTSHGIWRPTTVGMACA
jgi:NAD(P)-dependent dehydrogenase (short-subunit alcohol dehydrogenase family)